jgi:UDP-N-acetylmuramate--alanine ligase
LTEILDGVRRVHFIGIGGIGMLALAQYLQARGFEVSGSDTADSDLLRHLTQSGVDVDIGHRAENVENADLVVFTAAASRENVEVTEALRRGITIVKRAKLLGRICSSGSSVAIAGTHGKTTTTALTGHLVRAASVDATVFAGGLTRTGSGRFKGPALIGSNESFVVEADEYDRSFLQLHPDVAVVTNVEYDHPDCYETFESMVSAYADFLSQTAKRVIVEGTAFEVLRATALDVPVETYGTGPTDTWSAGGIEYTPTGTSFTLRYRGYSLGIFATKLLGLHNVCNAVGAVAAACTFTGITAEDLRQPLQTFVGTGRRLEVKGWASGVTVIDDYSHHPTEVRVTLSTLRVLDGRIRVVFQPHTFTRTKAFMGEFAQELSHADEVILLDVYGARELPIPGVDSDVLANELTKLGAQVTVCRPDSEAVDYVSRTAHAGDIVITMGAGSVTALGPQILNELAGASVGVR